MGPGWSRTVAIGFQGEAPFKFVPTPSASIVRVEVRLGGALAASADGADLRSILGLAFSVSRTPGPYPLTVYARDAEGCEATTTAPRIVTVQ